MQDIYMIVKAELEEKCEPQMNFILKCSRTAWSVCGGVHQKEEDLGGCGCGWANDQIKANWVQYCMQEYKHTRSFN